MKNNTLFVFACLALLQIFGCKSDPKADTPVQVKQYTIEQFYDNKSIFGGQFSPDESSLLVTGNETGIFNLYEIAIADGSKKQLTSSDKESFFAIDYVPGTGQVLYSADKGGDENDHIYLLKEDGSAQDLTPGEKEKANFAGWSLDKKHLYYLSNVRDPQFFDLYKMNTSDWKPVLIYKNEEGYEINGLSWDEKWLALAKSITTSENKLFLLETATKQMKEISDPSTPASYSVAGFSKDNTTLFYTTDSGKEFQYLNSLDLLSGKSQTIFETTWDVMYSYLSENEKYRVIAINEDGKNVLKITDLQNGTEVAFPSIPDGDILSVNISNSENLMRLSVGTSKSPANIYVYNFGTKQLKKLTETLNPEINADDLVAAEVVRFKSFDGLEIPAIFYKPKTASPVNKVPALVAVHGGPGGQSRTGFNADWQYLLNKGYAILAVNNRGSSGYGKTFFKMDDQNHGDKDLMDCIYGKKHLQSLDYIDSSKIGILGGSYGGFMTMAAMTIHPEEFAVGVNYFGVTNWLRTLKSIPPWWASFKDALYKEMGDPFTADSVRLFNISPLFHGDRVKKPVIVLQGSNDPRVLQVESDEMVAAIQKNNVPVEYVIFPDEGHGFVKKENQIKAGHAVGDFLDKYLKGISAPMN